MGPGRPRAKGAAATRTPLIVGAVLGVGLILAALLIGLNLARPPKRDNSDGVITAIALAARHRTDLSVDGRALKREIDDDCVGAARRIREMKKQSDLDGVIAALARCRADVVGFKAKEADRVQRYQAALDRLAGADPERRRVLQGAYDHRMGGAPSAANEVARRMNAELNDIDAMCALLKSHPNVWRPIDGKIGIADPELLDTAWWKLAHAEELAQHEDLNGTLVLKPDSLGDEAP